MRRQGEGLGPVGLDGGHGLLLWLAEGDQQGGRDQTGAATAPLTVDDQMLAIVQQRGQLWQRQLPGVFEGGIGGLIVFDGQVEPAHAFLLDLTTEVRQIQICQLGGGHERHYPVGTGKPQLIQCQWQRYLLGAGAGGQQQLAIDAGHFLAPEGMRRVHKGPYEACKGEGA